MQTPSSATIWGFLDRALLIAITWALTWAAGKGIIGEADIVAFAPALVTLVGGFIAWIVNRPQNLAAATEKTGAVVIAPPEVANKVDSSNVISTGANNSTITAAVEKLRDAA